MIGENYYPTINFEFKTEIIKNDKGFWQWNALLHIQGPDEIFDRQSAGFTTKEDATKNLLSRITIVFNELINEGGT